MKFPFHPWRRLLLCALPFAALLTACDDGKKEPPPKPAEVTTYNSVPWDALPATSDADLLAGFNAWRSACARLAKDPVWGEPCASATTVAADPTAVRAFLQERMQVYSLRSSSNGDQGLITGYYEPVYHGSLSQGEKPRCRSTAYRTTWWWSRWKASTRNSRVSACADAWKAGC